MRTVQAAVGKAVGIFSSNPNGDWSRRPRDSARFWARVATKQPVRKFIISHNGQSGRRNIEERSIRINVHSTTVNARIAIVFRWPAIVSVLCRAFLLLDLDALATMLFSLVAFK